MDDFFEGTKTFENARKLQDILISTVNWTTAKINRLSCNGPVGLLAILGVLFDSIVFFFSKNKMSGASAKKKTGGVVVDYPLDMLGQFIKSIQNRTKLNLI